MAGLHRTSAAAAVQCEGHVFIHHQRLNQYGLWQDFSITESADQPDLLGLDILAALGSPWPDISPEWRELMKPVLAVTGMSSERRFVARSAMATVERTRDLITIAPMRPDGRPGYSSMKDDPVYELTGPSTVELGDTVLAALVDSAAFERPRAR